MYLFFILSNSPTIDEIYSIILIFYLSNKNTVKEFDFENKKIIYPEISDREHFLKLLEKNFFILKYLQKSKSKINIDYCFKR
jgi:hypothetical protein